MIRDCSNCTQRAPVSTSPSIETALEGRRTADNIRRVRTLFQEDDRAYTGQFPIEPSVVVETSPGHFHRYWLIVGEWPADEDGRRDFRGVIERMIRDYGSDPGAKDICRVLRLPGFLNRKRAEAFQVRMRRYIHNCAATHATKSSGISADRGGPKVSPEVGQFRSFERLHPCSVRLRGILDKAASANEGERNKMVFWCANRVREMAAEGELDQGEFAQACGKLIKASTGTGISAQEAQRTIASAMR